MTAYYNEIDPFAAQWMRNLIAAGHLPEGHVDERSIVDVRPADLAGYTQCHFFAGIGGWPLALRLAGWSDDRPVWTGSCPCQPFSAAGKQGGFDDERHLWPFWFGLIRECRPRVVLGEQVASPLALGWLDAVHDDMEGADYAFAAFDLGAAGVGAPHIRQRIWYVADAERLGGEPDRLDLGKPSRGAEGEGDQRQRLWSDGRDGGAVGGMGLPDRTGPSAGRQAAALDGYGYPAFATGGRDAAGPLHVDWRDADWLLCRDGRWRPVEPGTFPLAHGVPGRVGRLRAYGNAIVPQVAAEFIGAYLECREK